MDNRPKVIKEAVDKITESEGCEFDPRWDIQILYNRNNYPIV